MCRSRPISLCAQYERRKCGGDRRRFLAARAARPRHPHPRRRFGFIPRRGAARHPPWSRRSRPRRRTLVLIMPANSDQPLRILHAVRAPVGGIFRHILDLANGQADHGHHVGIIADSLTGGARAEAALAEIAPRLKLGVRRVAIPRQPHPADILIWAHFMYLIWRLKPDVVHGHGAKAGAFLRLKARSKRAIRVYTP